MQILTKPTTQLYPIENYELRQFVTRYPFANFTDTCIPDTAENLRAKGHEIGGNCAYINLKYIEFLEEQGFELGHNLKILVGKNKLGMPIHAVPMIEIQGKWYYMDPSMGQTHPLSITQALQSQSEVSTESFPITKKPSIITIKPKSDTRFSVHFYVHTPKKTQIQQFTFNTNYTLNEIPNQKVRRAKNQQIGFFLKDLAIRLIDEQGAAIRATLRKNGLFEINSRQGKMKTPDPKDKKLHTLITPITNKIGISPAELLQLMQEAAHNKIDYDRSLEDNIAKAMKWKIQIAKDWMEGCKI